MQIIDSGSILSVEFIVRLNRFSKISVGKLQSLNDHIIIYQSCWAGFSESVSPIMSPFLCRYKTLPSSLRKKSTKFTLTPSLNSNWSPMAYSRTNEYPLSPVSLELTEHLMNLSTKETRISPDNYFETIPSFPNTKTKPEENSRVLNGNVSLVEKTSSLPAWVRSKKMAITNEDELITIHEKVIFL